MATSYGVIVLLIMLGRQLLIFKNRVAHECHDLVYQGRLRVSNYKLLEDSISRLVPRAVMPVLNASFLRDRVRPSLKSPSGLFEFNTFVIMNRPRKKEYQLVEDNNIIYCKKSNKSNTPNKVKCGKIAVTNWNGTPMCQHHYNKCEKHAEHQKLKRQKHEKIKPNFQIVPTVIGNSTVDIISTN